MGRHTDLRARAALLDEIVAYVLGNGLADLSLRPLALAVDASPRTLLYHFGSKAQLVASVLEEIARRQARVLEAWAERGAQQDARTLLLGAWGWLAAPRHERLLRLFFETYGLALRDRKRYAGFVRAATTDWIAPFARALESRGFPPERAAALASLLVAVLHGLLLDVLATGERARA